VVLLTLTAAVSVKPQRELRKSADEAVVTDRQTGNLLELLISCSKNQRNKRDRKIIDDLSQKPEVHQKVVLEVTLLESQRIYILTGNGRETQRRMEQSHIENDT
jgi:hypothetical protein